uniref:Uncharacterized protein n=1 Tax=Arundo donax TaxID=35708 RepID=A0A0A9ELE5_ARUDO
MARMSERAGFGEFDASALVVLLLQHGIQRCTVL